MCVFVCGFVFLFAQVYEYVCARVMVNVSKLSKQMETVMQLELCPVFIFFQACVFSRLVENHVSMVLLYILRVYTLYILNIVQFHL